MEYIRRCTVCGKIYCYTDQDLKNNQENAVVGAASAIGAIASIFGGTTYQTFELNKMSDRSLNKITDYNKCPNCGSSSTVILTSDELETYRNNEPVNTTAKPQMISINTNASPESLVERGMLFLEDQEWDKANVYFENALDADPKNVRAYIGKLLVDLHLSKEELLISCEEDFTDNPNYKKAIRFSTEQEKEKLESINKERINQLTKDLYNNAVSRMNSANSESAYKEAAEIFKTISGFKDADNLAEQCLGKAKEAKREVSLIIRALKEGNKTKSSLTLEEKLTEENNRVECLEYILSIFDSTLAKIQVLQNELNVAISKERQLTNQRSRLTIFQGKEKKRVDKEITTVTAKMSDLVNQIDQQQNTIGRYVTLEDVERDLNDARKNVSNLETQIENVHTVEGNEYSYNEALNIYRSKPNVAAMVDEIYPEAQLIPVKQGQVEIVKFGRQVQKENDQPEPIKWQVLAHESERILVISRYALDCRPYNTSLKSVSWETCTLREWLNGTFLNEAFSEGERAMIPSVTVSAEENPNFSTNPGNSTIDQVFLLSFTEAEKYFSSDSARQCQGTAYCRAHGMVNDNNGNCCWWLRSPGFYSSYAAFVKHEGSLHHQGYLVDGDSYAVRPALWIKIGS